MIKHSELAIYYSKKIKLLETLLRHLKEEERLLSYGEADSAVKIEFKNEPILKKLESLDIVAYEMQNAEPFSEDELALSQILFRILDEARSVQLVVQHLLEKEMIFAKKELWEVRIKSKLKSHFLQNSGLSWTKNYC